MKLPYISKKKILMNLGLCLLLVSTGWFLNNRLSPAQMGGVRSMPAPYVITTTVIEKDVSPSIRYVGHVEPVHAVDLQPKVTGEVIKVLFENGGLVKKNDVLFVIEQDKYIAIVKLREAELLNAEAAFKQAESDYKRQTSLNKQQFASEAALETSERNYMQTKSAIRQASANLDIAKLDLQYTEVRAPITGKIGKAFITEGNIVSATNQILARIVQFDPVRVSFSITDKDYISFRKLNLKNEKTLKTQLILADGKVISEDSISRFTDNEVKSTTATVTIFSDYENKNELLMPGSYIKVLISETTDMKSLLIPQVAIAQDELGSYVFVVKDNIAEQRRLELGEVYEDKQAVLLGLDLGENVIIQGLQKVANGMKVDATLMK